MTHFYYRAIDNNLVASHGQNYPIETWIGVLQDMARGYPPRRPQLLEVEHFACALPHGFDLEMHRP